MTEWLNKLQTTNFRIVVSVLLASLHSTIVIIAIVGRNWLPTSGQITVLTGVALGLLTMMGFDVIQFIGKRKTDHGYVAAKQGTPQNMNVNLTAEQPVPVVAVQPVEPPVKIELPEVMSKPLVRDD